jgi:hypothetical protein
MAYFVTALLMAIFFTLHRDRLKEPELMIPALIGFPIVFFALRGFLNKLFPKPATPIDKLIEKSMESEDEKAPKELPQATYKNWKDDLEKVVDNNMSLDEFLERWRGRGPDRNMKEIEAAKEKAPEQMKNRIREMLIEGRKNIGI